MNSFDPNHGRRPPRATASSVCHKCGSTFILDNEEVALADNVNLPSDMEPRRILNTWRDWVVHVMTYCPNCRYARPPSQCLRDRDRQSNY